jgi:hypothetical protein
MTPERRPEVKKHLAAVLERKPGERSAYLDRADWRNSAHRGRGPTVPAADTLMFRRRLPRMGNFWTMTCRPMVSAS